ncbi:MAG: hypothetical protein MPW15_01515 [Candidatus Manganitrophus sp.]|nr:hypothetical protein [Candidatus Manganitrophus sp.]
MALRFALVVLLVGEFGDDDAFLGEFRPPFPSNPASRCSSSPRTAMRSTTTSMSCFSFLS